MSRVFGDYALGLDGGIFFYRMAIISSGFGLIFLIILLKSKTTVEFLAEPYFFYLRHFCNHFLSFLE